MFEVQVFHHFQQITFASHMPRMNRCVHASCWSLQVKMAVSQSHVENSIYDNIFLIRNIKNKAVEYLISILWVYVTLIRFTSSTIQFSSSTPHWLLTFGVKWMINSSYILSYGTTLLPKTSLIHMNFPFMLFFLTHKYISLSPLISFDF